MSQPPIASISTAVASIQNWRGYSLNMIRSFLILIMLTYILSQDYSWFDQYSDEFIMLLIEWMELKYYNIIYLISYIYREIDS